MSGDLIR